MNIKELKEIIEIFENSRITEMDLERQGVRISLKKSGGGIDSEISVEAVRSDEAAIGDAAPGEELPGEESPENTAEIRTPMVGTFYRTPAPDAEPFVEEGDVVREGDVICIIEAMKLMNEIKSEVNGTVVKVLAENGQAVEFNQPLFIVEVE